MSRWTAWKRGVGVRSLVRMCVKGGRDGGYSLCIPDLEGGAGQGKHTEMQDIAGRSVAAPPVPYA